jgi:hypothetical protein
MQRTAATLVGLGALVFSGCSPDASEFGPTGTLDFEPERPQLAAPATAPVYTGTNSFVLEAQELHPTGLYLHRNVIVRTCGPTTGVCHNQKEYPDLHLSTLLLDAVNAPCNVQPGDPKNVFDGCEVNGDRLQLRDSREVEIGYITYVTGEVDYGDESMPTRESPGLHIELQSPLELNDGQTRTWGTARFLHTFEDAGQLSTVAIEHYDTAWYLIDGGKHLVGEVNEWQVEQVTQLLNRGILQGDVNQNGIYGAREVTPFNLLKAGDPERSYLIGRLRGELGGVKIPGTRMPLANQPLSIADMLALFCFVEGLPEQTDGVYNMDSPINYADCSWSSDPEGLNLLGNGATWLGRVKPLLEANCGGCHGGEEPQFGFDVLADGLYERLLTASMQNPNMPFVTPGDPTQSYLWLKLTAAEGIIGTGMPLDANAMVTQLPEGALTDIETWILNGAAEEE